MTAVCVYEVLTARMRRGADAAPVLTSRVFSAHRPPGASPPCSPSCPRRLCTTGPDVLIPLPCAWAPPLLRSSSEPPLAAPSSPHPAPGSGLSSEGASFRGPRGCLLGAITVPADCVASPANALCVTAPEAGSRDQGVSRVRSFGGWEKACLPAFGVLGSWVHHPDQHFILRWPSPCCVSAPKLLLLPRTLVALGEGLILTDDPLPKSGRVLRSWGRGLQWKVVEGAGFNA